MRLSVHLACVVVVLACGCTNDGNIVNLPPGCAEPEEATASALTAGGAPLSAGALVNAMGLQPAGAPPPSLEAEPAQVAVFAGVGDVVPTEGADFAWLSTGIAGAGTPLTAGTSGTLPGTNLGNVVCAGVGTYDCVELEFSFVVPEDHHTVRFDFRFFTTEYPEFVGAQFNDSFTVAMSSSSFDFANISFDEQDREIDVNSEFFQSSEVVECDGLVGTGFDVPFPDDPEECHGGATGLLGTIAPVAPGETVTLTFRLHEEGDGFYDSAVMIDHFETTEDEIESPETNDCD